jgi:phage FluMu protein Com
VSHAVFQEVEQGPPEEFRPFRCSRCGRLLCLEKLVEGTLKIKCRRCKSMNVLQIQQQSEQAESLTSGTK